MIKELSFDGKISAYEYNCSIRGKIQAAAVEQSERALLPVARDLSR